MYVSLTSKSTVIFDVKILCNANAGVAKPFRTGIEFAHSLSLAPAITNHIHLIATQNHPVYHLRLLPCSNIIQDIWGAWRFWVHFRAVDRIQAITTLLIVSAAIDGRLDVEESVVGAPEVGLDILTKNPSWRILPCRVSSKPEQAYDSYHFPLAFLERPTSYCSFALPGPLVPQRGWKWGHTKRTALQYSWCSGKRFVFNGKSSCEC